MTRWLAVAVAALFAFPASAGAHSVVTVFQTEIVYASEDAISDNRLTVAEDATEIVFTDPEADSGIQSSDARCRATATDSAGNPTELRCRKQGLSRVSVDLGPNEDVAVFNLGPQWQLIGAAGGSGRDEITVNAPGQAILSGDSGSDTLRGGAGNDDIRGDDGDDVLLGNGGNDRVQAGPGADQLDGGDGDDELLAPDGAADRVGCGGGADRVKADTVDEVAADCETVERNFVAPPADQPAGEDRTKPAVRVGGSTVQRISARRRTIRLAVTSSERGEVSASGFVDADGFNLPLKSKRYRIKAAGGGVYVHIKLSKRVWRHVWRDLKRGRRPRVTLNVAASDAAGNTAVSRRFRLRLRR